MVWCYWFLDIIKFVKLWWTFLILDTYCFEMSFDGNEAFSTIKDSFVILFLWKICNNGVFLWFWFHWKTGQMVIDFCFYLGFIWTRLGWFPEIFDSCQEGLVCKFLKIQRNLKISPALQLFLISLTHLSHSSSSYSKRASK